MEDDDDAWSPVELCDYAQSLLDELREARNRADDRQVLWELGQSVGTFADMKAKWPPKGLDRMTLELLIKVITAAIPLRTSIARARRNVPILPNDLTAVIDKIEELRRRLRPIAEYLSTGAPRHDAGFR